MYLHSPEQLLASLRNFVPLQECFNSPYLCTHFPQYAETIGYQPNQIYNVDKSESESVKVLSAAAKETGVWLLGGMYACALLAL